MAGWSTKSGKIVFSDNDSLNEFNKHALQLQADAKKIQDLQQQMVQ